VVHRMRHDPRQVASLLRDRDPDLGRIEQGGWTFCYHRSPEGALRLLDMRQEVGDILLAIDGRSSVEAIATGIFGNAALADQLVAVLEQLTQCGLLEWQPSEGTASCD